ncbi:MAG TPA: hypothetical protein PKC24_10610 [Cyclobacteriaceae bacterium]|nr:hypothetical protein [Cyclobacteriaceae bacterium]
MKKLFCCSFLLMLAFTVFANDDRDKDEPEAYKPFEIRSPKFWVVNFGTARTLAPRKFGFAAGMGGQVVLLGDPKLTSAFFTIPHAGFRYGISKKLDAGLRLAPIPLPFATVGPGFGINLDAKYWFTNPESKVDFALVLGIGGAHVLIEERNRYAYSPNAALLTSVSVAEKTHLTIMGRYVNLAIPTAPEGGADTNFVNIAGISFGLKKDIKSNIAILPEIGAYWYDGQIAGVSKRGPGFQWGLMIATSF